MAEQDDEQRERLLSGTERLESSSQRLLNSQRLANETEDIGASILSNLRGQREQIIHARDTLFEADGYVDKSMRTLKGMTRRMATNKMITAAIVAILILLIIFVIWAKFH